MNTLSLLLLAFIVIANVVADDRQQAWEDFKQGKEFESEEEENQRRETFLKNLDIIERHNSAGKATYKLGVNKYTDVSHRKLSNTTIEDIRNLHDNLPTFAPRGGDLPESVDWRDEGAVTGVKYQGNCGSCWAFTSVATVEAQHYLSTGDLVSLSEQNVVDCSIDSCDGGNVKNALTYITDNGINSEEDYPYEAQDGDCRFDADNVVATITGYARVPKHNENALAEVVATVGPVAVAINANDNFDNYAEGVFNDPDCTEDDINHGVVIIGYGNDPDGGDYWIVKNSYSESWGDGGFAKMARNVNMCGIASNPIYPTV